MNKLFRSPDSYKWSHYLLNRDDLMGMASYIEARGFKEPFFTEPEIVMMGTRAFIQDYMNDPITHEDIDFMKPIVIAHGLPFNEAGFRRIVDVWDGYYPVHIEALEEGTVVRTGIPMVQVCTLDPELPWLSTFIETALLRAIWYPTTVATLSREAKKIIKHRLEQTGDPAGLAFKFHDFGARGASSQESAELGGSAHLVNFLGTDTMEAVVNIIERYDVEGVPGYSIPATEHSISTAFGRDQEFEYAEKVVELLEKGAPLAACVSDTYDIYNFVENIIGTQLKDRIVASGGTLVVRPDSGDPIDVTLKIIKILGDKFGFTTNDKGFKVLPNCIRIIQGDGITLNMMERILWNFYLNGWSADNIAFGIGGGLLQQVTRDSLKFAQKANVAYLPEGGVPIYKDPITDPGKRSKAGWLRVGYVDDVLTVASLEEQTETYGKITENLLKPIFSYGPNLVVEENLMNGTDPSWANIRARAEVK